MMYRSLSSDLKSLIYDGESGVLKISHEYGGQANIYLKEGLIAGIEANGKTGTEAAKICVRWLSISTQFSKDQVEPPGHIKGVDTNAFLSALEKVNKITEKIQAIIPGNDAIISFDINKLDSQSQLASQELKVMMLLDGKRTIKEAVQESELSEIEVLSVIHKLSNLGITSILTAHKPMEEEERESFLNQLEETLSELIGPVSDMLISSAFEAMGFGPEHLPKNEIPSLIETIGANLEEEERAVLEKFAAAYV